MTFFSRIHSLLRATNTEIRGLSRYVFGKRGGRRVAGLRLFFRLRSMIMIRAGEQCASLARRTDVRVWVDGKDAFRRIEKLIGRAQHSIVIHMFIWKDDDVGRLIAALLLEAAERGVQIDITKEAVGDLFEWDADFFGTGQSHNPVWKAFWHHPHIRITHASDHNHTKAFVIDQQILLLTGMNIAREYRYDWHDYMVELKGTSFIEQFFQRKSQDVLQQSVRLVMNTEREKNIRPTLQCMLDAAKRSVVVEHCYLSDPDTTNRLIALSKRRVRVTVLLPTAMDFHNHANMRTCDRLLSEGRRSHMKVLLYPGVFHAKIILVDRVQAFIGSANFMRSSLDDMGEVNVLIRGRRRALKKIRESLRHDILLSHPMNVKHPLLWMSRWMAWLGL